MPLRTGLTAPTCRAGHANARQLDGLVRLGVVAQDRDRTDSRAITPLLDGPQLSSRWAARSASVLSDDELSILTSWVEAVADALALASDQLKVVGALAGAPWRHELGIPEPSPQFGRALGYMLRAASTATTANGHAPVDAVLRAVRDTQPGQPGLDRLVRRVLRSTLEERQARQPDD